LTQHNFARNHLTMYRNIRPAPLDMALVRGPHPTSKSYRNLRPAPLNMALVPGLHLSTSQGRCPPKPDEAVNTCSSKHCDSKIYEDSMDSCSTSADCESLVSFGETGDSRSEMQEACQDVDAMLQASEPSSPFSRMLEAKRQSTVPQATEPSSPFSSMLLRANRQNALTRGL